MKYKYPCTKHIDINGFGTYLEQEMKESRRNITLFTDELKKKFQAPYLTLVNSGSSANLVAALVLAEKIKASGKPLTATVSAFTFPTTISALIMAGFKLVTVDIEKNDEKDQVVQLVAEASSKDGTERFMYDSFIFHYDSSDNKKFIFWLIYGGMMGIVLLTYCAMHIYIFFKDEDSNPSLKMNDVSAVQNEEERETFNSGTTS